MPRCKDTVWSTPYINDTMSVSTSDAQLNVLMDIRDELKALNRIIGCHNFIDVPSRLTFIRQNTASALGELVKIRKNTTKKRRRRAKKATV